MRSLGKFPDVDRLDLPFDLPYRVMDGSAFGTDQAQHLMRQRQPRILLQGPLR
jgi:hypothetical protein